VSVGLGIGSVIGLGDIAVDADGGVFMEGLRVESDGSVSMGSEIDVALLTEAMEKPGASVNVSILFDSGSAELTPTGKEQVAQVAEAFFLFDDDVRILVEGHTDNVGSDADNFALSNARSQTVVNELLLVHDVDVSLLMGGKGESSPVADNDSPQGRGLKARNSRMYPSVRIRSSSSHRCRTPNVCGRSVAFIPSNKEQKVLSAQHVHEKTDVQGATWR